MAVAVESTFDRSRAHFRRGEFKADYCSVGQSGTNNQKKKERNAISEELRSLRQVGRKDAADSRRDARDGIRDPVPPPLPPKKMSRDSH